MPSTPRPSRPGRRPLAAVAPGILAAGVAVTLAFLAHGVFPWMPALTVCVALGVLASNVPLPAGGRVLRRGLAPGMGFAAQRLMRAGIVLLGLQLVVSDVAALGWGGVAAVLGVVVAAFAGTWAMARLFRLPGDQPVLLAAGFSICGASAIGAMAHVRGTQRDAAVPLALVTLCGTLAIPLLPALNSLLLLGPVEFGHWVGASVHDVGQVVATAQTAGSAALGAAVVVKLVRVLALAPVTLCGGLAARRSGEVPGGERVPLVPLFVVGFAAMVALRSTGWAPEGLLDAARAAQEALLGAALVGLGYAINLRVLFRNAGRATAAALSAWFIVGAAGLAAALLLAD